MASLQEQAEYAQDRLEAIADIAEAGFLMSFGVLTPAANSYDPPGAFQETGKANVLPMEWNADFSGDVMKDDKFYLVTDEVDLRACTHCLHPDGDLYMVCGVESYKYDNISNLFYMAQTRGVYIGARDT